MIQSTDTLSLGTILRRFWPRITVTAVLLLTETLLYTLIPLLIGKAIDGLLADDLAAFWRLGAVLFALLVVATLRRVYDTRVYGSIRVALALAQSARQGARPVSRLNAQVLMGRELVDFLETTAPETLHGLVGVSVSLMVLLAYDPLLAASAGLAALLMLAIYAGSAGRFYRLNADLNGRSEDQVRVLSALRPRALGLHFARLRQHEVRLSDTESVVYGLIFMGLLVMLAVNLWYGSTQLGARAGEIFAIVSYSMEFLESAIALPMALQSLTRLKEITARING